MTQPTATVRIHRSVSNGNVTIIALIFSNPADPNREQMIAEIQQALKDAAIGLSNIIAMHGAPITLMELTEPCPKLHAVDDALQCVISGKPDITLEKTIDEKSALGSAFPKTV